MNNIFSKLLSFFAFIFVISFSLVSCSQSSITEEITIDYDPLYVELYQREFFVNDVIDLTDVHVYQVTDVSTNTKVELEDYKISWEDDGEKIVHGEKITRPQGEYGWIFQAPGCKRYKILIYVYEVTSEKIEIYSYPKRTIFYQDGVNDKFSTEGLHVRRKIGFSLEAGSKKTQTRIFDVDLSKCSFTYYYNYLKQPPLFEGAVLPFENLTGSSLAITISTPSLYLITKGGRNQTLSCSYNIFISGGDYSGVSPISYEHNKSETYNTEDEITIDIKNFNIDSARQSGTNNFIAPSQVEHIQGLSTYRQKNALKRYNAPSKGDVPILVIPVFYDFFQEYYSDNNKDEVINLIKKCFFGSSDSLYFESLQSFYYKSSFGQLNLTGQVAPAFNGKGINGTIDVSKNNSTEKLTASFGSIFNIISEAVSYLKNIGFDMREYDSDGDGFIDAIWLISCSPIDTRNMVAGWAYTSFIETSTPNLSSPNPNVFSFCPVGMLDGRICEEQTGKIGKNYEADSHIIIHETGHLLGLNDYYSTNTLYRYTVDDPVQKDAKGNPIPVKFYYGPTGGVDMMDKDYLDHNSYSKLMLGWTKPYIVYGNSKITLRPSLYQDQVIVIPYDSLNYSESKYLNNRGKVEFNPFDEYIVIEYCTTKTKYDANLYKNDNLLLKDYEVYRANAPTIDGLRIYHVDRRSIIIHSDNSSDLITSIKDINNMSDKDKMFSPVSNSDTGIDSESNNLSITAYGSLKFNNFNDEVAAIPSNPNYMVHKDTYASAEEVNNVIFDSRKTISFLPQQHTVKFKITNNLPIKGSRDEDKEYFSKFEEAPNVTVKLSSLSNLKDSITYIYKHGNINNYYSSTQWNLIQKYATSSVTTAELNTIKGFELAPYFKGVLFNNGNLFNYHLGVFL